jgi:hypothetical protein
VTESRWPTSKFKVARKGGRANPGELIVNSARSVSECARVDNLSGVSRKEVLGVLKFKGSGWLEKNWKISRMKIFGVKNRFKKFSKKR